MVNFSLLARRDRIGKMLDAAARAGLVPKEGWLKMDASRAKELFPGFQAHATRADMYGAAFHYLVTLIMPLDEPSLEAAEQAVGATTYQYACSLAPDHLENVFRGVKENCRGG